MPQFIPGLELSRLFYHEAVRPILQEDFPNLAHSAALIGTGSEVLGFDDAMSTDHNWGVRVILYLSEQDHPQFADRLRETLGNRLPFSFRGYPTCFEEREDEPGTFLARYSERRPIPINHNVRIRTLPATLRHDLGADIAGGPTLLDWLTIPEQSLRAITAGAVYHDGLNVLEPLRRKLAYYPHDVWLYLISAQWQRIGQEEPFVGRAGIVGDDLGSSVIASRLVRDLMRLCMLLEKQYAPYPKWFGTAFARLPCADRLLPLFENILRATDWQERERNLATAYEILATMHNDKGITKPVPTKVTPFHGRPFMVIQGESIARTTWEAIQDAEVKKLPYGVGKVDQFVDSTDILSSPERFQKLRALYAQ